MLIGMPDLNELSNIKKGRGRMLENNVSVWLGLTTLFRCVAI